MIHYIRKDGATLCLAMFFLCFLTCTNTSEDRGKTITPFLFNEDFDLDSVFAASEAKMNADAAKFDSNVRIIKKARLVSRRVQRRVPELRPAKDTVEFIESHQSPHGKWFEQ